MSLTYALEAAVNGTTGPRATLFYGLDRTKRRRRRSGREPTPGILPRRGGRRSGHGHFFWISRSSRRIRFSRRRRPSSSAPRWSRPPRDRRNVLTLQPGPQRPPPNPEALRRLRQRPLPRADQRNGFTTELLGYGGRVLGMDTTSFPLGRTDPGDQVSTHPGAFQPLLLDVLASAPAPDDMGAEYDVEWSQGLNATVHEPVPWSVNLPGMERRTFDHRTVFVLFQGAKIFLSIRLRNIGGGLAVIDGDSVKLTGSLVGNIEWRTISATTFRSARRRASTSSTPPSLGPVTPGDAWARDVRHCVGTRRALPGLRRRATVDREVQIVRRGEQIEWSCLVERVDQESPNEDEPRTGEIPATASPAQPAAIDQPSGIERQQVMGNKVNPFVRGEAAVRICTGRLAMGYRPGRNDQAGGPCRRHPARGDVASGPWLRRDARLRASKARDRHTDHRGGPAHRDARWPGRRFIPHAAR